MVHCPYCSEPIASGAEHCSHCGRWFADQLIGLTTHADASVREAAVNNLIFVARTRESVAAVAQALNDPVQDVRRAAGVTMFAFGDAAKHVVPALIAALDATDYFVRRTAAAALSNCGAHGAPALSRLNELRDTDDDQLRAWIAEAQGRIGDAVQRGTA